MSRHGTCFDNGMSGNCDVDCEQFLEGGCDATDDVLDGLVADIRDEMVREIIGGVHWWLVKDILTLDEKHKIISDSLGGTNETD